MEGIPVKISEKYKPPRKISLPASIQSKLNNVIQFEKYDFELEKFVLEQMGKLKEERKTIDSKPVDISNFKEKAKTISLNRKSVEKILTPIPHKPHIDNVSKSQQVVGGINISDFENDTSSPFDSVELKTINDMEVLAHVLGGTSVDAKEHWTGNENGSSTQNWAWDYSGSPTYPLHPPQLSSISVENETGMKNRENENNEVSTIMTNLKKRIEERNVALEMRKMNTSSHSIAAGVASKDSVIEKKIETLPNPFSTLSGPCQLVSRRLAEMGFPISRAARATEMFGPNEGKVIEFMLEVQSLEECGYPGESAERAFVACEFSRDAALKFLDSLTQIMKLGFSENEVISALFKAEFDRDKALDSLIS